MLKKQARTPAASMFEAWQDVDKRILLWVFAPLVLFGFMLNVRLFPMIAPNEEPKWAVLTICGAWVALAALWVQWRAGRLPLFAFTWASLALSLFYLFLLIGVFIAPNVTEGLIRFSFWFSCLGVFLTVCWAWRYVPVFHTAWVWMVTLAIFVFSFRYWQGYMLDYGMLNYNISVLFSPIGHVNFTGDVLIILLPVLMCLLLTQAHMVLRILNWVSVVTVSTVLLLASSRGALGGVVLSMLMLLVLLVRHREFVLAQVWKKAHFWLPVSLLLSALITSFSIYEILPYHYRDLARVSGSVESTAAVQYKPLTANVVQPPIAATWNALTPVLGARTPMYASAMAMALDAPVWGQGTGNFYAVYPKFSNKFPDFSDPLSNDRTFTTNPHNVVLQIATQQGFIAMILFMGLLLFFWWRLLKAVWQKWDMWKASGVMAMTAVLFDAMFNHVFFNPASMFSFALFAGVWWAVLEPRPHIVQCRLPASTCKPVLVSCVLLVLLLSVWPTRWLISEWYAGSAMLHIHQPVLAGAEYKQAYAWDTDNFRAVFGMAQIAYKQKSYDDAVAYLQHFEIIYPYNPPALNLLGAAYLMRGDYAEGEKAFKRAVAILPNFKAAQINLQRTQALLWRH